MPGLHIEHEIVEGEHLLWLLATAKQRSHTRQQLFGREGLEQVVVCPGVETSNSSRNGISRRQHQHRQREPLRPQSPANGKSVQVGKTHVKHEQVRECPFDLGKRGTAIGGGAHLIPFRREGPLEHPADWCVVVDDENGTTHAVSVGMAAGTTRFR